jgi:hypothetical protein
LRAEKQDADFRRNQRQVGKNLSSSAGSSRFFKNMTRSVPKQASVWVFKRFLMTVLCDLEVRKSLNDDWSKEIN